MESLSDAERIVANPPYMRSALKDAIEILLEELVTQREAAKRAGMNESVLGRALKKPHIQAYIEARKALFIERMERLRAPYKASAIKHAHYLMKNARSETVQARMVEFLAREDQARRAPATQVNVAVDARQGGYEYGQRPDPGAVDSTSSDVTPQEPEK